MSAKQGLTKQTSTQQVLANFYKAGDNYVNDDRTGANKADARNIEVLAKYMFSKLS